MWERTFSTSESWSANPRRIRSCLCICLKLDSILNVALKNELPPPSSSGLMSVQVSWDKRDKNHQAMQGTGALILCLYIVMSAPALSHDARWHRGLTWSSSPFLSPPVPSPVAEQVTARRAATFLRRPWRHAVTARASLRAEHVTLHLLASLSAILPGMLTRMTQLLMTHIWLLRKSRFTVNEIRAAILWEAWKLSRIRHINAGSSAVTSGKVWKRKAINVTQRGVNEKHKQKWSAALTSGLPALVWPLRAWLMDCTLTCTLRQARAAVGIWAI